MSTKKRHITLTVPEIFSFKEDSNPFIFNAFEINSSFELFYFTETLQKDLLMDLGSVFHFRIL